MDEDGLPDWNGDGLNLESYARLLDGDVPDEDLNDEERATRRRLAPYAEVFSRLEKTEEGEDVS